MREWKNKPCKRYADGSLAGPGDLTLAAIVERLEALVAIGDRALAYAMGPRSVVTSDGVTTVILDPSSPAPAAPTLSVEERNALVDAATVLNAKGVLKSAVILDQLRARLTEPRP